MLIVFDRLFGTCRDERPDVPIRYGLVDPVDSYNPVTIAFHAWVKLGRDLRRARGVRQVAMTLFGPPGYIPGSAKKVRPGH